MAIRRAFGASLRTIAPVYRTQGSADDAALVSPLPHVLVVRLLEDGVGRRRQLERLRRLGLRHDPRKSLYLSPFDYFVIADSVPGGSHKLRERLLTSKLGIDDVRFETMPFLKPTTFVPNDTLFATQWNMSRIGATKPHAAWELSRGRSDVVVCILDEGCDLAHPDLRFASLGINLGSMTGDGRPTGPHGTACAGVAAAIVDNALGVAGVAGDCSILPAAFQNWTDVEVATGIDFAIAHGARVISMSFGQYGSGDGIGPSGWDFALIAPAIERAFRQGIVLVAATGNENLGGLIRFPARHARVIAVGASDQIDNRKSPASPDGEGWGANFGAEISVVAPGVRIETTDRRGSAGYNTSGGSPGDFTPGFNGTSSATPHVAGLAALVLTLCPTHSAGDVRMIIERTAAKVGALVYGPRAGFDNGTRNQEMGYGRIDVAQAAREAFLYTVACLG